MEKDSKERCVIELIDFQGFYTDLWRETLLKKLQNRFELGKWHYMSENDICHYSEGISTSRIYSATILFQ